MTTEIVPKPASQTPDTLRVHPVLEASGARATKRFLEYFATQIANDNTRAAYTQAVAQFLDWCQPRSLTLQAVEPIHVAAYLKTHHGSAPTKKQHLAALRMLFDWLVIKHVLPVNPAGSVRGPKYVVKKGKTPVLSVADARTLLDSIPIERENKDGNKEPIILGLRDRALIGVMVFSFARISAVLGMKVEDYYPNGKRWWIRLHEKGGKFHEVPAHHNAEAYLDEYIRVAGIAEDRKGPLFRSVHGFSGRLTTRPLARENAYAMVRRRAARAGIAVHIGCHTFRATGITAYLDNGGTIENAQAIAAHESPRTTKLYDRTGDEITLDEIEKIVI